VLVKKSAFLLGFLFLGCSTPTKSRMAATTIGFSSGLIVGGSTTPVGERQDMHALYWGGILGIISSFASNYYFNDQDALQNSQLENEKLRAEIELFKNANKILVKEGSGYFKNAQGEEYFKSGKAKWRIYQIDKWSKDGPNHLYHQDKMVELIPNEK
jgi:hypothetical protein